MVQLSQWRAAQIVAEGCHTRRMIATCLVDDEAVFRRLAMNVNELYKDIDNTFWEAKLHEIDPPGRTSTVKNIGPNAWEVRMRDVNLLPFDFHQTQQVMWTFQTARTNPKVRILARLSRLSSPDLHLMLT